jgi:hypothetical protein
MDSMMCFTIVFIFDAGLLLVFWNVWFFWFCFSFFCGLRRWMYVLEYSPQNVQGRLDYWNLSLRLSHSHQRYNETWVVT